MVKTFIYSDLSLIVVVVRAGKRSEGDEEEIDMQMERREGMTMEEMEMEDN